MNLSMNRFNDVQTHASAVNDWRQTYSQISAGNLQSSLAQIKSQRLHVFREQINQRVVQHGEAPRGKVCFAVPIAIPGAIRMQGREADETSLFVLRGGEEFMFHMPMGMDMLSLTFDSELFDHALDDSPDAENIEKLLKQPVIRIPTHRFSECRRRLVAMFSEAIADGTASTQTGFEPNLESALLDELMELLADHHLKSLERQPTSVHSFIVERCHHLTVSDTFNPPNVIDLCERLKISRRTIQNSFKNVTETTPTHYIRSIRLNGARRELMSTHSAELSIGDAASKWGFSHLSHFAADYHGLFGELPSQTLRAERRPVATTQH